MADQKKTKRLMVNQRGCLMVCCSKSGAKKRLMVLQNKRDRTKTKRSTVIQRVRGPKTFVLLSKKGAKKPMVL